MTAAQPDILIVNPGITFVLPPDRPDSRSVMLQSSLAESEHTSLYDEVISIYDTAPVIREKLANLIAGSRPVRRHEPLSSREKEIVVCLVKGMTNRRIAEHLHLSHHTVGTHRRNISAKLDIHSTSGLTVYAISNKLVRLGELETRR